MDGSTARPGRLATLAAVLLLASACGAGGGGAETTGLRVIATTSVIGDVVTGLVGDAGTVDVLIEPGVDPHGFAPSAADAAALREVDLVVANGLGLEAELDDTLAAAEADGVPVIRVAELVDPLPAGAGHADEHADEHEQASSGPALDPHVWFDPQRMAAAVEAVAERLATIAPDRTDWSARAAEVAADLTALDREVATILDAVPPACRRLVTSHEALGYLAARYDLEIIGTVIPGLSSQAEPSARDLAELVATVRDAGVPAIFTEDGGGTALAGTLADEVGRDVEVVALYTEGLGEPGSGADSYAGMLRTDAERIAAALADCGS